MLCYGEITFLLSKLHPVVLACSGRLHVLQKFTCSWSPNSVAPSHPRNLCTALTCGMSLRWLHRGTQWAGPCHSGQVDSHACPFSVPAGWLWGGDRRLGEQHGMEWPEPNTSWECLCVWLLDKHMQSGWRWMLGAKSPAGCNPLPSVHRCLRVAVRVQQYVSQLFASAPSLTKLESRWKDNATQRCVTLKNAGIS